jgi:hypothetical protein
MHFFHSPVSYQSSIEPSLYAPKDVFYLESGLCDEFVELLFPMGQWLVFISFFQNVVL